MNWFTYCSNSPLVNVDPTGTTESSFTFWDGLGPIVGGAVSSGVADTALALTEVALTVQLASSDSENVRNPFGKDGSPEHQEPLNKLKPSKEGGEIEREVRFSTPDGSKKYRVADAVERFKGEVKRIYQSGKVNKNGTPVAREMETACDIMLSPDYNGAPIYFLPYNVPGEPIIFIP